MEKLITLKKARRKRKHGFLVRMRSHGGRKTLARRRVKSRRKLTVKK